MRILMIGAGAVGIAIGVSFESQGIQVDFLARGKTLEAIRSEGAKRTGLFGDYCCAPGSVGAYGTYEELPRQAYDYVIISAKTTANLQISQALWKAEQCMKPSAKLVIMQNGWGNEAAYEEYFPKDKIYHARVITGFQRTSPNVSQITVHTAPILLGSLFGSEVTSMQPLQQALQASGIPTELTTEVGKYLWAKMLYNTTLNPLGAILGVHYGQLAQSQASTLIMNQLIEETFAVMKAAGYSAPWENAEEYKKVFYGTLIPDTYHHRASTLQDIEKKQKTEIDTLNGCIVRLAKQYGIPVPGHTMLVRLIKSIEDNF